MDRLRAMEVFVAVAEAGTFAAASGTLGMSPPAVTRTIAALENSLGVQLLTRSTRRFCLTEAGARYVESSRRLLAEIEMAERVACGRAAMPHGSLAITSSVAFGRLHAVDLVADFLDRHPQITVSVIMLDRVVNLIDEGVDVALRIGELPDSSLKAARVGETGRILVASRDYLDRRGAPERPGDLKKHDMIALSGLMPGHELTFANEAGRSTMVKVAPRLRFNDSEAALAAAEGGEGIAVALSYMLVPRDMLVRVLERFDPPPKPIHIVYPHARLLAPKIRAFVDFASPWLRSRLG